MSASILSRIALAATIISGIAAPAMAADTLILRDEGTSSVSFAAPQSSQQVAAHSAAPVEHLTLRDDSASSVAFH